MKKALTWKRTTALATCALMLAASAAGGLATMDHGVASAAEAITVDAAKGLQTFDGWGLSLSWWATEIGDWTRKGSSGKEKREEIVEALFGKSGLDLNIARYNVGGGDDPTHTHMSDDRNTPGWKYAEVQEFTDPSGQTYKAPVVDKDYVWVGENGEILPWTELENLDVRNDWRQLWVLNQIQQDYESRPNGESEDYKTEYYSNSPPFWMTMSGCSSGGVGGGQNLDYSNNQAFVDYFLDVYEYLVGQGFQLDNLQPFNESVNPDSRNSSYWSVNSDQEGCYFNAEQKVIVLDLLQKEMEKRGIEAVYNWGDETNTTGAHQEYESALGVNYNYGDGEYAVGSDVVRGADRYTYHIYWYDQGGLERFYREAKADGKPLYMSEIAWSNPADDGTANYDPESLNTGFHYTQSIIDTIKYGGVDAFVFWQGMEDMVGQIAGKTNYGLIQGVYYTQEEAEAQGVDLASMGYTYQDYVLSKSYYLSGQYTKYIRPGYQIIDADDGNTIAAISPDGETLVIVKQNDGTNGASINFDLKGFKAESAEKIVTDNNNNWAKSRISVNAGSLSDDISARSVTTYVIHGKKTAGDSKFLDDSTFKKKNSLTEITAAIEEEPETEAVYVQNWGPGGGGCAKYYGDTSTTENGLAAVHFKGTGIAIAVPMKRDAGQLQGWIDPEDPTNLSGTPDIDVDTYDEVDKNHYKGGIMVGRTNDLEDGWHTVYLKSARSARGNTWVNLDGVFIYTSLDAEADENTLAITSASGVGTNLKFGYTVSDGLLDYTVYAEYADAKKGVWQTSDALENPATAPVVLHDINFKNVLLRLCAEKDGEKIYSSEYAVKMTEVLTPTEGVLYFVDCGTADPQSLAPGAVLGTLQGVSDQALGEDVGTGYEWGYKGTFSSSFNGTDDAMSSMHTTENLTGNAGDNGQVIEYQFSIPTAGTYRVALGFFGGNDLGWGERTVKYTVTGTNDSEPSATVTLKAVTYDVKTVEITAIENDTITVKVERSAEGDNNSLLSLIAITEEETKLPLYAKLADAEAAEKPASSDLNTYTFNAEDIVIGEDIYEKAKTHSFKLVYSDGSEAAIAGEPVISVACNSVISGQRAKVTYAYEDINCYYTYLWNAAGGGGLYYNIDIGYVVSAPAPDDTKELGKYQSTTHDREFGPDSTGYSWGYVGSHYDDGAMWEDDVNNKWSIREAKDESNGQKQLEYRMTGFQPNESLIIEVTGHCSSWGGRKFDVLANGTNIMTVSLETSVDPGDQVETGEATADGAGNLSVICRHNTGDAPLVAYIKVSSAGVELDDSAALTVDKTEANAGDTVTLSGLTVNENNTVYVYDDIGNLLESFSPTAETKEYKIDEYLKAGATELHFTQASYKYIDEDEFEGLLPCAEVVVTVNAEEEADVEVLLDEDYVKEGEAAVMRFVPVTTRGVISLTLHTPDGVDYNLLEGFFYRAMHNGEYTVRMVEAVTKDVVEKTFTLDKIDETDLHLTLSEEGWTKNPVTVTFAPTAQSGAVTDVKLDGNPVTAADGKYSFTASENGVHTVTFTSEAGYEYTKEIAIDNIDPADPEVTLSVGFGADGLSVDYEAIAASGGALHYTLDGKDYVVSDGLSLDRAGKYEIYYVNGAGVSTEKQVYYVAYGVENANLADVSVAADGQVTVTEKARAELVKHLYRAGGEEITSLKAEKAGKYYLALESGGESELLVFYVRSAAQGGGTGDSSVIGGGASNGAVGGMIAGVVIGCVALVGALVACVVIIVKRRKNS